MTNAHHHASRDHQRGGCEAIFFGSKKRCNDNVAPCLQLAVRLDNNAVAKTVHHQCLLRFSKPQLPGSARMLERGQRRRSSSTVMTADQHNVSFCLRHSGCNSSDTHFGNQLDVNTCERVRIFQVMNELLEIFNRIDVMVWRWANETNTRGGVARLRNPRVHLVTGQLTALTRLRTLSHFDLNVVRVGEVLGCHTKTARGDLLNRGTTLRIVQTIRIFASLSGIRFCANRIHRNRKCFVRFSRDRTIRHRSGREALHD